MATLQLRLSQSEGDSRSHMGNLQGLFRIRWDSLLNTKQHLEQQPSTSSTSTAWGTVSQSGSYIEVKHVDRKPIQRLLASIQKSMEHSPYWELEYTFLYPIGSMCGIFIYIYPQNQPDVGAYRYIYIIYTPYMDPMDITPRILYMIWKDVKWPNYCHLQVGVGRPSCNVCKRCSRDASTRYMPFL